jgi:hypothetical protein
VFDVAFALLILALLFVGIGSLFALQWRLVLQDDEGVALPPVNAVSRQRRASHFRADLATTANAGANEPTGVRHFQVSDTS